MDVTKPTGGDSWSSFPLGDLSYNLWIYCLLKTPQTWVTKPSMVLSFVFLVTASEESRPTGQLQLFWSSGFWSLLLFLPKPVGDRIFSEAVPLHLCRWRCRGGGGGDRKLQSAGAVRVLSILIEFTGRTTIGLKAWPQVPTTDDDIVVRRGRASGSNGRNAVVVRTFTTTSSCSKCPVSAAEWPNQR